MPMTSDSTGNSTRAAVRRGITLIEMLVVVAIVSLMVGISYPSVARGLEGIRLRMAGDDLASFLSLAMNRVEKLEAPVEVRFLRSQRKVEMAGPNMPVRTLQLPENIGLGEIYPVVPGEPQGDRSVLLMPGAPFPRLSIELTSRSGGKRLVRIDPVTGTPVIDEQAGPQAGAKAE
jgi:prepilin-type N-terminal cleavage/methylation domain-containing protein